MELSLIEMIKDVEFSNDNSQLLHKNKTENGLTYFGIYQSAHPNWKGWTIINRYLANISDLKECSRVLANVSDLNKLVYDFYKVEFYDKMKLGLINDYSKKEELMCFGINTNPIRCIKKVQELLGLKIDGVIGNKTITAINAFNEDLFDVLFDKEEIEFYDSLDESRFGIYKKGWRNRAKKY